MFSPRSETQTRDLEFWTIVRSMVLFAVLIPNGYLRLKPLIHDAISFVSRVGFHRTVGEAIPACLRSIPEWFGLSDAAVLALTFTTFLYAYLAARGLMIGLVRLVLFLGFRVEESGDSVLLHPHEHEEDAS